MKRIAKFAAVGAAGLGLVLGATPAQAAPVGALAFVGSASLTGGIGYPVVGTDGSGNGWTFSITTGVGAGVEGTNVAVGAASGGVSGGTLTPGLSGLGAFCGASGGTGGGGAIVIDNVAGADATIAFDNDSTNTTPDNPVGWLQSVGSLILFTDNNGAVAGASVIGLVSAIPPLPVLGTGSCSSNSAQDFTIVGAGVSLG